ncbi:MAG: hypothetical protein PUD07_00690 [bacterium]|nr:hypothetical protein [bacterium]
MDSEKQYAVVIKKIKNGVYKPIEIVNGILEDTSFICVNGKKYHSFGSYERKLVTFILEESKLKMLYQIEDENILKEKFLNDIKNYYILNKNNEIYFLYKGNELELINSDEIANHFIQTFINNDSNLFTPKNLYNELKNNVFMQDDAIKKIVVAVSTHLFDSHEKSKGNIIIDGMKGSGKEEIIKVLKNNLPMDVFVEDLSNENFSFDLLFLSLANDNENHENAMLILDNADKLLLSSDRDVAQDSLNVIKDLMNGIDYKISASQGLINYPTNNLFIVIMGDFSKRGLCGINQYASGVPDKLSELSCYNIKLNPVSREMLKLKLCHPETGILTHYIDLIKSFCFDFNIDDDFIEEIINISLTTGEDLDKVVKYALENAMFELFTSEEYHSSLNIGTRTLKNNHDYELK